MFKIQIPKPCHEDWNAMTTTQQGAFCGSCSKEVVDFTKMTDEEVQNYFLYKSAGKTCGRFKTEQVHRIRITLPENLLLQKIAGWKKFMAVVMLAFGSMLFGCDVGMKQDTLGIIEKTQVISNDTSKGKVESLQMLGEVAPTCIDTTVTTQETVITGIIAVPEPPTPEIMGDVMITPDSLIHPTIDTTVIMGAPLPTKKPASDTSKCKDTGYY